MDGSDQTDPFSFEALTEKRAAGGHSCPFVGGVDPQVCVDWKLAGVEASVALDRRSLALPDDDHQVDVTADTAISASVRADAADSLHRRVASHNIGGPAAGGGQYRVTIRPS